MPRGLAGVWSRYAARREAAVSSGRSHELGGGAVFTMAWLNRKPKSARPSKPETLLLPHRRLNTLCECLALALTKEVAWLPTMSNEK